MNPDAELQEYLSLVEPTLEAARETVIAAFRARLASRMTSHEIDTLLQQDAEVQIRLESEILDVALQTTARNMRDLTRLCVEIIYRAAKDELWRFGRSGEEFVSLRDWAYNRLQPYLDKSYIGRFVNTVEKMLLPIDTLHIVDTSSGQLIDGLSLVRTASIRELKERPYTFMLATDDKRECIARLLHENAPREEMQKVHREVMEGSPRQDAGDPDSLQGASNYTRIPILFEMANGGWHVQFQRQLTSKELGLLQALLGEAIEIEWVRELGIAV